MERFDLSSSGLYKLTRDGRFPEPFNVGGKLLWRETDLAAVENGTWKSAHPKPAPPVVDAEDPFEGLDAILAPAPLKRPRGRPPGSKTKARASTPVLAKALPPASYANDRLPAHLGGPTLLDHMRGAR